MNSVDEYGESVVLKSIIEGTVTEVVDDTVTSVGYYAFAYCYSLTTVSFPAATSIGSHAFRDCRNLATVSFPAVTSIGSNAFFSCSSLTTASFPATTNIWNNAFRSCYSLTTASFPVATSIEKFAFYGCRNLVELHLESVPSVPTLSSSVFFSTPIGGYSAQAGRYGSIYVPASLYDAFLSANNWSVFSSRIVSVA